MGAIVSTVEKVSKKLQTVCAHPKQFNVFLLIYDGVCLNQNHLHIIWQTNWGKPFSRQCILLLSTNKNLCRCKNAFSKVQNNVTSVLIPFSCVYFPNKCQHTTYYNNDTNKIQFYFYSNFFFKVIIAYLTRTFVFFLSVLLLPECWIMQTSSSCT